MIHHLSQEAIKSSRTLAEIKTDLHSLFPDFSFSGGESYYRGSHLEGKREDGITFSLEDQGTADAVALEVPEHTEKDIAALRAHYGYNLDVAGPDQEVVEKIFQTLLEVVTR